MQNRPRKTENIITFSSLKKRINDGNEGIGQNDGLFLLYIPFWQKESKVYLN